MLFMLSALYNRGNGMSKAHRLTKLVISPNRAYSSNFYLLELLATLLDHTSDGTHLFVLSIAIDYK